MTSREPGRRSLGTLAQTSCADTTEAVVPGGNWGAVHASARMRGLPSCGSRPQGGLVVRVASFGDCAADADDYVVCVIDFSYKRLYVGRQDKGCIIPSGKYDGQDALVVLGEWYLMEATASGNTVTCRVSGGSLAAPVSVSWTDATTPASGTAGLTTSGLSAEFDDFVVTSP